MLKIDALLVLLHSGGGKWVGLGKYQCTYVSKIWSLIYFQMGPTLAGRLDPTHITCIQRQGRRKKMEKGRRRWPRACPFNNKTKSLGHGTGMGLKWSPNPSQWDLARLVRPMCSPASWGCVLLVDLMGQVGGSDCKYRPNSNSSVE